MDDRPVSFEQVFLNALPSHWVKLPFREWKSISIRDEYILHLSGAKTAIEAKAVALGALSSLKAAIEPVIAKQQDIQISSPSTRLNLATQPETNSSLLVKMNAAPIGPNVVHESQQIEKTLDPVKQVLHEQAPQLASDNTVERAFATIKSMFESLSPRDQRRLWEYLVQEYDPR